MAGKSSSGPRTFRMKGKRILVIEARYYEDVANELAAGAVAEIEASGAEVVRVEVPGALEIPQVLAAASSAGRCGDDPLALNPFGADDDDEDEDPPARFDGVVALGCVIRGETSHYDIVCDNANHWLMHLACMNSVPVGNAILTVDTKDQALARAKGGRAGKGGEAARACLRLIEIAEQFKDGEL